jgi:hypothetical protein
MTIHFTVFGHPVGYTRTTQKSIWKPNYQRYLDYKSAVVAAFLDQVPGDWGYPQPLTTTEEFRTEMDTLIYFRNGIHPDPSNVHKAIEDALFACDKFCDGNFKGRYDKENPRVEVTLR